MKPKYLCVKSEDKSSRKLGRGWVNSRTRVRAQLGVSCERTYNLTRNKSDAIEMHFQHK